MARSLRRDARPEGETVAAEDGRQVVEMSPAELERARTAFRGSLESSKAWRAFSTNTRHHDTTYWSLLCSLFAEPGMNRTMLIERIIAYAGVSRSTAERAIREAKACGYIIDRPAGNEVHHFLSDRLFAHCVAFFRAHMDLEQIVKNLGYDR
jgi:hypothetical protein